MLYLGKKKNLGLNVSGGKSHILHAPYVNHMYNMQFTLRLH